MNYTLAGNIKPKQNYGSFEQNGSTWLYHTPAGYITLKDGIHHYFARDYQGSTRAVYRENQGATPGYGDQQNSTTYALDVPSVTISTYTLDERMSYFASGLPYRRDCDGISLYNNSARLHDPITATFITQDPLANNYTTISPYANTPGNPVNAADYNGMEIDFNGLKNADISLKINQTSNVNDDMLMITGLKMSLDEKGIWNFAKDEKGNAIVATTTNANGETVEIGSPTARALVIDAVKNEDISVKVMFSKTGSKYDDNNNFIGLNNTQIDEFINGAVGVDGRTLGYGMTFLHELLHSPLGGNHKDTTKDFGTGGVVDTMNQIRNELNKQGYNFGERMNYKSHVIDNNAILPFNQPALNLIKGETNLGGTPKYIQTPIK